VYPLMQAFDYFKSVISGHADHGPAVNEVDIRGWKHCQRHIHTLKYEQGQVGITFQDAIGRLVSVIKSIRPKKIIFKWNQNEAELLSKFFLLLLPHHSASARRLKHTPDSEWQSQEFLARK